MATSSGARDQPTTTFPSCCVVRRWPHCPALPQGAQGWIRSSDPWVPFGGGRWSFTTVTLCVPCSRAFQPGALTRAAGACGLYPARAGWAGGGHWRRKGFGVGTRTIDPAPRVAAQSGCCAGRRGRRAPRCRPRGGGCAGTAARSRTDDASTGTSSFGVSTNGATVGIRRLQTTSAGGDDEPRGASLGNNRGPGRPGVSSQSSRSILSCPLRFDPSSARCRRVTVVSHRWYATLKLMPE